MPRGGYREGSGGKPKWIRGKTTVIRVPESLAEEILRIARLIDEGKEIDDVTQSKYLDLSGISIHQVNGKAVVFLEDLLNSGFKIRPLELVDRLRKQIDRRFQDVREHHHPHIEQLPSSSARRRRIH